MFLRKLGRIMAEQLSSAYRDPAFDYPETSIEMFERSSGLKDKAALRPTWQDKAQRQRCFKLTLFPSRAVTPRSLLHQNPVNLQSRSIIR